MYVRSARIVFAGLSITSSWGNGHATNFRGLMRALHEQGHEVTFFERDVPWYAQHRDLPDPPWGNIVLYESVDELRREHAGTIEAADLVVVGSYVPEGVAVANLVCDVAAGITAFYDIDTPVTISKLEAGDDEYLARDLVSRFDLYLSFTGGPTLEVLEQAFGARRAVGFYCIADPSIYFPEEVESRWHLGYLGTYSDDRQPTVKRLLLQPARRRDDLSFAVAGPQYPQSVEWPANVDRFDHIPPDRHRTFYNAQRFTLNVTRAKMIEAGYSPSVRLFEAACCGVPVISDEWPGLGDFFELGSEILVASSSDDVLGFLADVSDEERRAIGARARERVIREHTPEVRAGQLLALLVKAGSVEPV